MSDMKKFVLSFCGTVVVSMVLVLCFNAYIDPLWLFPDMSNNYNGVQHYIDEQRLKTNQLYFTHKKYDTLVMGSSGVSFLDVDCLLGHQAYNYAGAGFGPSSYANYLKFAKNDCNQKIKTVFLGLEFIKTNKNIQQDVSVQEKYLTPTQKTLYRFENLLSVKTLKYAVRNIRMRQKNSLDWSYDRFNHHFNIEMSLESLNENIKEGRQSYQELYCKYEYDDNYVEYLKKLKNENPDVNFVVFTVPNSKPMYSLLLENNLYDDYEHWLRDIVSVFGSVHNFLWDNEFMNNPYNYHDGNHYTSKAGQQICNALIAGDSLNDMYLTKENFEHQKTKLQKGFLKTPFVSY